MLNAFRDNLKSLKWVLWLVAVAMIGFLGSYFISPGNAPTGPLAEVASVDGAKITTIEVQRRAQQIDRTNRERFGEAYEQLVQNFPPGQIALNSLIEHRLILGDAERLGLDASPEEVASFIYEQYTDANGQFIGKEQYTQFAKRQFGSVEALEDLIRQDLTVNKWNNMLTEAIVITERELEGAYRDQYERVEVDYFVVPSSAQPTPDAPSDDQIRGYYDENPDTFRREAGRQVHYLKLDQSAVTDSVEITEEEIAASYEANRASYVRPGQRRARHILLKVAPGSDETARAEVRTRAEALLARVQGGEDFGQIAQETSEDTLSARNGGDLNFFPRGQMVPAFDQAAFSTAVGEFAPVVETEFGFHVLQVTGERPEGEVPLGEVRDDIRRTLEASRVEEELEALAASLISQIDSAASMVTLSAQGPGRSSDRMYVTQTTRSTPLGTGIGFVDDVFDASVGSTLDPQLVTGGVALVYVEEELDAGVAPFDDVKDQARDGWMNARLSAAALEAANGAMADVSTLADAATAAGQELRPSGSVTRAASLPLTGGGNAAIAARLFAEDAEIGQRGVIEVPSGAMAYEITSITGFDNLDYLTKKAELESRLVQQRQSQLIGQVLERLRDKADVRVDDALAAQLTQVSAS